MLSKENTKEQVAARLTRMQKEDIVLSNNQQILNLPEGYIIGKAIGGGDCFFDAVAQGLKHLKPDMEFTVKSLRQVCKNLALSDQQLRDKVIRDAKDIHDSKVVLPDPSISDDELWNVYLASIEYTAEDIEGMKTQDPQLYKSLTSLKYGSTLQVPIWGRAHIEGRMICSKYKVKLHIIENLPHAGWSDQLVDGLASRSIDYVDYSEENTIHIINKGGSHFEPILRKQILPHCYDTMVSEKKSDSKSVYFQQVSEKDMTDNQMDCEYYATRSSTDVEMSHAESTMEAIDNYKGGLSDEEFQRERIQESPRVIRSSSISSSSKWYSALNDTANSVSLTDDEITKKATFFVKTFVKEFEKEISKYSKEAKPGSKRRKSGKIKDQLVSIVNNLIPPNLSRLGAFKVVEGIGVVSAKEHRQKAKRISAAVVPLEDQVREVLVEASLEIFQNFEEQMTKVMDISWKRGIEKLAIDAVSRLINYISEPNKERKSSVPDKEKVSPVSDITKGVILGKSKIDTFAKQVLHKPANFFKSKAFQPGYQVKDKQSNKTLITSKLYRGVGIKKIEGETIKYYQLKEHGCTEKYGYRLPFAWELEKWEEVEQKYVLSKASEERYVHILDEEKKKKLASSILKEINGEGPVQKKDIEILCEKLENSQIKKEENRSPFSFNLGCLPEFFIRREMMLDELKKKLSSKNQEVEMSRMVLISGEYGTGKSELARSYGYNKGKDSNVWTNVIWINARVYGTLLDSFHRLAERLKIPTKNGQEINTDMEVKEQQEREIKSIVKDIYENFRDVKSLFIFDNANEFEEIERFLPSHFSDLFFGKEKPYVLITSRNKNWKKEIEKIDLDNGFSLGEAITFIERTLEIKNTLQDQYLVELVKALKHLPLALAQATAYIKQEGINISEYLKRYNEAVQEPSPDRLEALGVTKELFTTLTLNLDKIKREKNIGQQSHDIVAHMAYLSPDQIDIEEIFLQKKSEQDKQLALGALDRLHKFSVIELEESIARIHMGVQKTIRVEKEREKTEEETLRNIMTSFCPTDKNHITSVWSYVSKYDKLVNEFIDSIYDGSTILQLLAKDGNEEVIKLILEKVDSNKLSKIINAVDEAERTPLDYAAMYGHLEIVKYFMEKGAIINLWDESDKSALYWAVVYDRLEIVKYFVNNKYFELDEFLEYGSLLNYATIYGYLDIVEYLVEKRTNINLYNEDDKSPLHFAAEYGYLDIVKYLVEKGANIDLKDEDGLSPLHYAIYEGDRLGIIEYLVEKGASVNLRDKDGLSSLHYAVENAYLGLDIAKYLVEKGANIDLKDEDGLSPLHFAVNKNGCLDIVKYFVEKGASVNLEDKDGLSPLHYVAKNGCLDIVKYFVEKGASINLQDKYGLSPLHYVAKNGCLDITKYLIEKGASVNLEDKDGLSPLHFAAEYGYLDIVKCLVEKGANIDLKDEDGLSPLHYAIYEGDRLGIIEYLVEKGASVNLRDKDGLSSLHYAVENAYLGLDIAKYLIEKGASVNLEDKDGLSPLHYVAKNGCLDIAKYLIEKGASINLQDEYGMSPLHYATIAKCPATVQYLITHEEANVDLKDDNNNTPLDCAVITSNLDIAERLLELGAKMNQKSKDFLYRHASSNNYPDIIRYLKAQSSALDLKTQSHKRQQRESEYSSELKKRKLENMSAASEKNTSNIQLLQGSHNLSSDISMLSVDLFNRMEMESMVNFTNMPMFSFNSVAVESVNNKSLRR